MEIAMCIFLLTICRQSLVIFHVVECLYICGSDSHSSYVASGLFLKGSYQFTHPITHNIRRLSHQKQRMYNILKQLVHHTNGKHITNLKEKHWLAYSNYVSSLAEEDHVSKRLWTFIMSQRKDYCSVPPVEFEGNTYSEHFDKAESTQQLFLLRFYHRITPSLENVPFPSILPVLMGFNNCWGTLMCTSLQDQIVYQHVYWKSWAWNLHQPLPTYFKHHCNRAVYQLNGKTQM